MDAEPNSPQTYLTWTNVAIGSSFIFADSIVSFALGLGIGGSLLTAAVRCVLQLSVTALVLQKVFEAENFWGVAGIAGMHIRRPNRRAQADSR